MAWVLIAGGMLFSAFALAVDGVFVYGRPFGATLRVGCVCRPEFSIIR